MHFPAGMGPRPRLGATSKCLDLESWRLGLGLGLDFGLDFDLSGLEPITTNAI